MTATAGAPHIGLVVEGTGDAGAVPTLLRMYLQSRGDFRDILGKPVPVHGRENALVAGGLEGYVATAARPGCRAVLVVLDGEGDCVASLGPALLERATKAIAQPVVIALADRDYEDWIFASAETVGLPDLAYIEGGNGQASIKRALKPRKYAKPIWQPRLTSKIDITLATSRNESLRRTLERFEGLAKIL